jgi:DNA-binding CsgD family transcriptional regulator
MRIAQLQREINAAHTLKQILQVLVTNTLKAYAPIYAFVAQSGEKGAFSLLEQFGAESEKDLDKHLSDINQNSQHPLSLAFKTSQFICVDSLPEIKSREKSTGYQQLIHMDSSTQVLVVGFAEPTSHEPGLAILFEVISQMLVSYHSVNSLSKPSKMTKSAIDPLLTSTLSEINLSERQFQIAKMIADGLTNRQISRQLGFTEATIRYETIKLYERLRVRNRAQASSRIRELIT